MPSCAQLHCHTFPAPSHCCTLRFILPLSSAFQVALLQLSRHPVLIKLALPCVIHRAIAPSGATIKLAAWALCPAQSCHQALLPSLIICNFLIVAYHSLFCGRRAFSAFCGQWALSAFCGQQAHSVFCGRRAHSPVCARQALPAFCSWQALSAFLRPAGSLSILRPAGLSAF